VFVGVKYDKARPTFEIHDRHLRRWMIEWQAAGAWDEIIATIAKTRSSRASRGTALGRRANERT